MAAKWSNKPWSGFSESDYTPEQFANACIIDLNPSGKTPVKDLCYLPYKEPDGTPNVNGLMAAAGGRGLLRIKKPDSLSAEQWATEKRKAARKIIALYKQVGRVAPESIYRVAGEKRPAEKQAS